VLTCPFGRLTRFGPRLAPVEMRPENR
jgi:hypothetical protein